MEKIVLIVAGGSGVRMNSAIPKQFLELNGKPVLMHTIETFFQYHPGIKIRLVLPESQFEYWSQLCEKNNFTIKYQLIAGGENRFNSVKNGLRGIPDNILVAVHDGVRPLVSIDTIKATFETAQIYGAAIPVIDIEETIREIKNEKSFTVDRNNFKIVQTPQIFKSEILTKAYNQPYQDFFTDDASIVESMGHKIFHTVGTKGNIKITTPLDIAIANTIISGNYSSL